ncbi:MAG: LacI family DNA-binding transcriptional regulator [Pseudomonadales bacterium]|jgi:LacI family transcriptional regulator
MFEGSKPKVDDVARLAGVSTATVSRFLNTPERVSEKTRKKVGAAVEELGYTPNFGGRYLASQTSRTMGAIIPTMENAIFAKGIQAFQEVLADAGITLLISTSSYDHEQEFENIRTLIGQGAEGLLLIGTARPQSTYDFLARRNIPYVIAWNHRWDGKHLYVGFDNHAAMRELTQTVLEMGHKDIAMIAGPTQFNDRIEDRIAGAKAAIEEVEGAQLILKSCSSNYSPSLAGQAFAELMQLNHKPSVILCSNDVLAVGAIMQARKMNISVPEDISITGFDDIDIAEIVTPTLATVHVPHGRMGQAAAGLLLKMRAGDTNNKSIKLSTNTVLRESLRYYP